MKVFLLPLLLVLNKWLPPPPVAPAATPAGLQVRVRPVFGTEKLELETQPYPTATNGKVSVTTCRFYLSDLQLTYTDGSTYTEPRSYHLVDAGQEASQLIQLPDAPRKALRRLRFSLGVDSTANVSGAQGGDLDPARGMYWAWHSGYVNAKLEGTCAVCPPPHREFSFHLGGFQKPYNSLRQVTLEVPARLARQPELLVQADVAAWLAQVALASTNSVLIAGPAAQQQADAAVRMFSLMVPAGSRGEKAAITVK